MTRQEAAEFKKMATYFKQDMRAIDKPASAENVMRWLYNGRNVGKRFGWTLLKVGYEQAEPVQTGSPE